ncbi:hypothetical protein Esti_004649 [Eimeria stiedai]
MSKASVAEPEGHLPDATQSLKEKKTKAAKTRLMERQKVRDYRSLSKLQRANSGVVPYHEVDTELSEPHQKRRRSSTASSRSDTVSLHPEDGQRSHLCASRAESRVDSLCSTQQPTTPTGQAGTPNRTCTSPSNHSDSGATVAAATAAAAEATVAAAAVTVGAAARVSVEEEKETPSPSPLASPTPSLPSDGESCCLRPLLPPGLPVSHPCDSSLCAPPPTELPRASPPQGEEGPCYCDVEGYLPGQGGALLGPHYADIHTEKEYLGLPKRPIKIMTYTNSGGYTEVMCADEEEKSSAAPTEDASAAAASPPPSPAPLAAAEPPPTTTSGAHQAATGSGSSGGYQRILWADEVIDASYRRKVWYRTDLHTFFSWLRSPSRHRPVKQRTYNARSLGYSEAKRLAFQFHPEECGDADFKKVYYLWKLKMKGKKKEEEAAAAALSCKDETAAAAATAGSTGEGPADAADALSAGGAEASAPVQQPPQLRRGWGAKRRNTRQRGLIQEAAGEQQQQQQQQQQAPPASVVARDVLSGSAGFCFSLSTPRQLRHLRDFGTISCAGLEDALFTSKNEKRPSGHFDAGGPLPASAEKAEEEESLQVVGVEAWDFGTAGCITFAAPYEDDFDQQNDAHDTFNGGSEQLQYQQQEQQYSQEEVQLRRAEACDEGLPSTHQQLQVQRRPQQRQSQAALRRRLAEEEQRRLLIAQQQAEKQQREKEQQQQQQELEQRQRQRQQQDYQQQCYQHRHEELHLQQQRQEQHRQLWQKAEAQRQLLQKHREEAMQQSRKGGTHQQQQARPHQRQARQQQQRQQAAGGAQSRDSQQQLPFDALSQQREDSYEVERQRQLLQQQQQLERKQEEAAAAALAQRHKEIASLLQHLNPLVRQRLEALLRSGALGKVGGSQAA